MFTTSPTCTTTRSWHRPQLHEDPAPLRPLLLSRRPGPGLLADRQRILGFIHRRRSRPPSSRSWPTTTGVPALGGVLAASPRSASRRRSSLPPRPRRAPLGLRRERRLNHELRDLRVLPAQAEREPSLLEPGGHLSIDAESRGLRYVDAALPPAVIQHALTKCVKSGDVVKPERTRIDRGSAVAFQVGGQAPCSVLTPAAGGRFRILPPSPAASCLGPSWLWATSATIRAAPNFVNTRNACRSVPSLPLVGVGEGDHSRSMTGCRTYMILPIAGPGRS